MKRTACVLALTVALVPSLSAVPAGAHTRTCTHGEHYHGHDGRYLLHFVRHYDRRGRHVHVYEWRADRTWYGSYRTIVGYVVNRRC